MDSKYPEQLQDTIKQLQDTINKIEKRLIEFKTDFKRTQPSLSYDHIADLHRVKADGIHMVADRILSIITGDK